MSAPLVVSLIRNNHVEKLIYLGCYVLSRYSEKIYLLKGGVVWHVNVFLCFYQFV